MPLGPRPAVRHRGPGPTLPSTTCVCAHASPKRNPSGSRTTRSASAPPMTNTPARNAPCPSGGGIIPSSTTSANGALRSTLSRLRTAERVGTCMAFTPKIFFPGLCPWNRASATQRNRMESTPPAGPPSRYMPSATAASTTRAPSRSQREALG